MCASTTENIDRNRESAKEKLEMPVLALGAFSLHSLQQVAKDVRGGVVERCGRYMVTERPHYVAEQLLVFFGEEG